MIAARAPKSKNDASPLDILAAGRRLRRRDKQRREARGAKSPEHRSRHFVGNASGRERRICEISVQINIRECVTQNALCLLQNKLHKSCAKHQKAAKWVNGLPIDQRQSCFCFYDSSITRILYSRHG
jgi:hypothetical protein